MYKNLKTFRESLNLTQKEFAASLGIAQTTYNGYETGARDPKSDFWIAVAERYNVTIDYLMGYSDDPKGYSGSSNLLRVDFGHGEAKKAPSQRDEADEVADIYRALDDHGKGAVKAILDFEHAAAIAEQRQMGSGTKKAKAVRKRSDGFIEVKVYDQIAAAGLGNYLDSPDSHIEQYPANLIPEGTDFGIRISGNSMEPDIRDGSTAFVQSRSTIETGSVGIFLLNGEAFCKRLEVDRYEGKVRLVSINKAYQPREIEEFDDFKTLGLVLGSYPK